MTRNEPLELIEYNEWANERLLKACANLSQNQWSQDLGGSYPTLLLLISHIVGAEWIWLRRWKGESPASAPDWLTRPSPSTLHKALKHVEQERRKFLEALSEDEFEREVHYTLLDGSKGALHLGVLLQHGVNHSTYHRGQIASMLRRLNVAPPATDLLVFAAEREARTEALSGG
jgi:uncharacterized damage-inducible protein DinB